MLETSTQNEVLTHTEFSYTLFKVKNTNFHDIGCQVFWEVGEKGINSYVSNAFRN